MVREDDNNCEIRILVVYCVVKETDNMRAGRMGHEYIRNSKNGGCFQFCCFQIFKPWICIGGKKGGYPESD